MPLQQSSNNPCLELVMPCLLAIIGGLLLGERVLDGGVLLDELCGSRHAEHQGPQSPEGQQNKLSKARGVC